MIHMVVLASGKCGGDPLDPHMAAIDIGDITKMVPMMVVITAACAINKNIIRCITTEQILWVINLIARC